MVLLHCFNKYQRRQKHQPVNGFRNLPPWLFTKKHAVGDGHCNVSFPHIRIRSHDQWTMWPVNILTTQSSSQNWLWFMLQWVLRFTEFIEFPLHLGKVYKNKKNLYSLNLFNCMQWTFPQPLMEIEMVKVVKNKARVNQTCVGKQLWLDWTIKLVLRPNPVSLIDHHRIECSKETFMSCNPRVIQDVIYQEFPPYGILTLVGTVSFYWLLS